MDTQKRKYQKHKKGYTVSVTYFLKKDKSLIEKLFSKESTETAPKFPVYVRVAFLQQTVGIHSRLSVRLTEQEFDNYFQRQDVKDFIDIERAVILHSVEEFRPETIENVSISQWTKYYNENNAKIKECAEEVILEKFKADIIPANKIEDERITTAFELLSTDLSIIKALNLAGFDKAQSCYKRYDTIFEIDDYNKAILDTADFTLWDWKLGLYQAAIKRVHGHKSNKFLNVLTDLINEYQIKHNL